MDTVMLVVIKSIVDCLVNVKKRIGSVGLHHSYMAILVPDDSLLPFAQPKKIILMIKSSHFSSGISTAD